MYLGEKAHSVLRKYPLEAVCDLPKMCSAPALEPPRKATPRVRDVQKSSQQYFRRYGCDHKCHVILLTVSVLWGAMLSYLWCIINYARNPPPFYNLHPT